MKIETSSVITLTNIDPGFRDAIKELNRHDNPDYVTAKQFGYDMEGIDRYIYDYRYDERLDKLVVPRGQGHRFQMNGVTVEETDLRVFSPVTLPASGIILRKYQDFGFNQIGDAKEGVVIAPTGAGKTIIGLTLIERKKQKALILVHTKELLKQWKKEVKAIFGFEPGIVNDEQSVTDRPITIAMFQSANANIERLDPTSYGLVLVDECHHTPANTFSYVLDQIPAAYRYGLSATPKRRDNLQDILYNRLGPKIADIPFKMVQDAGGILPARVTVVETGIVPTFKKEIKVKDPRTGRPTVKIIDAKVRKTNWHEYLTALAENRHRNQFIADVAINASATIPTLILVERVEHAEAIYELTGGVLLHGKLADVTREEAMEATAKAGITVGTPGLLGEGVDVSGWGHLILATPMSDEARILQAIGRVIRPGEGKDFGYLTDFIDNHSLSISSASKRQKVYASRDYQVKRVKADVGRTVLKPKRIDLKAIRDKEQADKLAKKALRAAEKLAERAAIDRRKAHRADAKVLRDNIKRRKALVREEKHAIKLEELALKEKVASISMSI